MRWLVLLLALANGGYYAWTQGWLADVLGFPADHQREPYRMAAQVQPQSLVVLTPQAASAALVTAKAAAKAASVCLEVGPFTPETVARAEASLGPVVPADAVRRVERQQAGVWIVYMGPYNDNVNLQKKKAEIARLRLVQETVRLQPQGPLGLSLGRYSTRPAAEAALAQLAPRGVRTAKVVALVEPSTRIWLNVPQADPDLAPRLQALKDEALNGGFRPCVKPPAGAAG